MISTRLRLARKLTTPLPLPRKRRIQIHAIQRLGPNSIRQHHGVRSQPRHPIRLTPHVARIKHSLPLPLNQEPDAPNAMVGLNKRDANLIPLAHLDRRRRIKRYALQPRLQVAVGLPRSPATLMLPFFKFGSVVILIVNCVRKRGSQSLMERSRTMESGRQQ